jgi:hypothetical protein
VKGRRNQSPGRSSTAPTAPTAAHDEGRAFRIAFVAAAVLAGALANMGPIGTNDIGFHLRLGQEIAETGWPPNVDSHSHTCPGAPYPDHEWLAQLGLYGVHAAFGDPGLAALQGLLIGACLLIVAISIRGPGALRIALIVAVLVLGFDHSEIRPHIVGWVMMGLLALLLERRRKVPVLVLLLVWANTHGSVLLGVGLAGLSFLEESVERKNPRPLAWAAAVAIVPLANPNFFEIYTLFFTIKEHAGFVGEWKPYGVDTAQFWLIAALVGASLVGILRRRPINWFDLARVAVLAVLSFQSSRSGVVMAIFLSPSFGRWFGPDLARRSIRIQRAAAIGLAVLVVFLLGQRIREGKTLRFELDHEHLPVAATRFIRTHDLKGPVFNDYNFGGYLLWKAWPELPVFVDGRIEVYRGRVLDDYLAVSEARSGWEEIVRRYGITFFVIRPDRPLARALLGRAGWDLAYFDYNSAIFVRRDLFPELRRLRIVSPFGHRDRTQVALAIDETRYLLGENPLFFGGYKILAFLQFRSGDLRGARDSLRRYVALHPEGIDDEETRSLVDKLRRRGAWP